MARIIFLTNGAEHWVLVAKEKKTVHENSNLKWTTDQCPRDKTRTLSEESTGRNLCAF